MALVFLVLAFVAGSALPVQAGLNARLATFVGGPIRASMISFGIGTLVLFVLSLLVTQGRDQHLAPRRGALVGAGSAARSAPGTWRRRWRPRRGSAR